jgi:arylsulfatase A-like enzyme
MTGGRITHCLGIASIALMLCFSRIYAVDPKSPVPPNVILCMADDMGWGDPGFNGNRIIKTPSLDEMASNGMRFDRFYSGAPVCSPTRGSCLTGRHPWRYGIWFANEGHLRKPELNLAEVLRMQGYMTGHFGKWHLGTLSSTQSGKGVGRNTQRNYMTPGMSGFDEWFATEYSVRTWNPVQDNTVNPYYHNGELAKENLEGCDSRVLMDRAIPFIRKAAADKKPFFAVIWFHAPHEPVVAGPEYRQLYSDREEGEQHFFGAITALDSQMGRLRRELRELGLAENTMLWFTSDNGPEGDTGDKGTQRGSAGPFRGRKRSLWEGGIHVPGLLEWPARIKPGSATTIPCSTLDYYPTTLEVLGLMPNGQPEPRDGVSLVPLFDGRMKERPVPIPFETMGGTGSKTSRGSPRMALVDNRYKLLTDMDDNDEPLLFDLLTDPGEATNLAKKFPERVAKMKNTLVDFRESCKMSLAGKNYAEAFIPDDDDIHPATTGARGKTKK